MHVINVRNVRHALARGVEHLRSRGTVQRSQYGDVLVTPHPVVTAYGRPRERVLLSAKRDANPFFHLMEALWMLAGRRDAKFLDKYVTDFSRRFAEEDGSLHDAYGDRWRHGMGVDQLDVIVKRLSENPDDRQCVLQMWDASPFEDDLCGPWRTRPCNTHVYFRVRDGFLDITVCCRSNDIIWGAYGSNAVHFSILQEYAASRVDCAVGIYYQVSNNYHAYLGELDKEKYADASALLDDRSLAPSPLVHEPDCFDAELAELMRAIDEGRDSVPAFANRFLHETAFYVDHSMTHWRAGAKREALELASLIDAEDWRTACVEWFHRRMSK